MRLRAALLLVVAAVVLAPAASAVAAEQRGGGSPTWAVKLHYRYIASEKYLSAYRMFTPAARKQYGPYAKWKRGYSKTAQLTIEKLRRRGRTTTFTLTACRLSNPGESDTFMFDVFSVMWPTRNVRGRWYLDRRAKIRKTETYGFDRCQLSPP